MESLAFKEFMRANPAVEKQLKDALRARDEAERERERDEAGQARHCSILVFIMAS